MSPLLLTVKHLARASLCMDLLFQLGEVSEDGPHGTGHTSLRTHGEGPKRKHRRTHGEGPGRNGTQMSNMRLIKENHRLRQEKRVMQRHCVHPSDELQSKLNDTFVQIAKMRCSLTSMASYSNAARRTLADAAIRHLCVLSPAFLCSYFILHTYL